LYLGRPRHERAANRIAFITLVLKHGTEVDVSLPLSIKPMTASGVMMEVACW
jgi:hypothetical protein